MEGKAFNEFAAIFVAWCVREGLAKGGLAPDLRAYFPLTGSVQVAAEGVNEGRAVSLCRFEYEAARGRKWSSDARQDYSVRKALVDASERLIAVEYAWVKDGVGGRTTCDYYLFDASGFLKSIALKTLPVNLS